MSTPQVASALCCLGSQLHFSAESVREVSLWDTETHNCEGRLFLTSGLIVYLFSFLGHYEGAL